MEDLLAAGRLGRTHDGRERQRAFGCGGATSKLPTARAKLFFLLFYFKCYPLQEVMSVLFGLSQPQACEWIKRLTPLVGAVIERELLLPMRRPADLDKLLQEIPELRLLILDGAERPIRRPKDRQRKKDDYSGKKKAHRERNLLVSSHEWRVVYLGPTLSGSVHDKKLADRSGLLSRQRVGAQGYGLPGLCAIRQPKSFNPPRSHADASFTPGKRPSTKWSVSCAWASSTPSAESNAAASSPAPSATCARGSCTRPWS